MEGITRETYYKIHYQDNTCYIGRTTRKPKDRLIESKCNIKNPDTYSQPDILEVYEKYGCEEWWVETLFVEVGDNKHHTKIELKLVQDTPNNRNRNVGDYTLTSTKEYNKTQWSKHGHKENKKSKEKRLGPEGDEIRRKEREKKQENKEERNRKQREVRKGPKGAEIRRKEKEQWGKKMEDPKFRDDFNKKQNERYHANKKLKRDGK
mgnify:CR=1 FL=1